MDHDTADRNPNLATLEDDGHDDDDESPHDGCENRCDRVPGGRTEKGHLTPIGNSCREQTLRDVAKNQEGRTADTIAVVAAGKDDNDRRARDHGNHSHDAEKRIIVMCQHGKLQG